MIPGLVIDFMDVTVLLYEYGTLLTFVWAPCAYEGAICIYGRFSPFYGRDDSLYGTLSPFVWAPYTYLRALFELMGAFLLFMGAMTCFMGHFIPSYGLCDDSYKMILPSYATFLIIYTNKNPKRITRVSFLFGLAYYVHFKFSSN